MNKPKQIFQAGGATSTNRNPIIKTIVKGKDDKGSYTDTNTNQADDLYPGASRPAHKTNAWFNNLTTAQKAAHNKAVREKEASLVADKTVKGMSATNRVYDPLPKPAAKQPIVPVRRWTREEVVQPFGGHSTVGSTNDPVMVEKGYAKNRIDRTNPASSKNTYEARDFTPKETLLWNKGRLSDRDNPIGKDTIGRGASLDKKIAIMTAPRKKIVPPAPSTLVVSKEDGGRMINGKVFKHKPVLNQKPKIKTGTNASDDCGCGKMQGGGDFMAPTYKKPAKPATYSVVNPAGPAPTKVKTVAPAGGAQTTTQQEIIKQQLKGNTYQLLNRSKQAAAAARAAQSAKRDLRSPSSAAGLYADGGNIPSIDDESPIRH